MYYAALLYYLGVFQTQTESPALPYELQNLPDKTNRSVPFDGKQAKKKTKSVDKKPMTTT